MKRLVFGLHRTNPMLKAETMQADWSQQYCSLYMLLLLNSSAKLSFDSFCFASRWIFVCKISQNKPFSTRFCFKKVLFQENEVSHWAVHNKVKVVLMGLSWVCAFSKQSLKQISKWSSFTCTVPKLEICPILKCHFLNK